MSHKTKYTLVGAGVGLLIMLALTSIAAAAPEGWEPWRMALATWWVIPTAALIGRTYPG